MSSSLAGSGRRSFAVRMKRSCSGPPGWASDAGCHRVAGGTLGKNLRGPTRRSYKGAIELRQLPAAVSRSVGLSSKCTSFSAPTKVDVETTGPTSGAVPKAGGAPGVELDGDAAAEFGAGLRHAASAVIKTAEARLKKWRREFGMLSDNCSWVVCGLPPDPLIPDHRQTKNHRFARLPTFGLRSPFADSRRVFADPCFSCFPSALRLVFMGGRKQR